MADDGEDFFFLLSLVLDDEAALVPSPLADEAALPSPLVFLGSNESGTGGCRTVYPGGTA